MNSQFKHVNTESKPLTMNNEELLSLTYRGVDAMGENPDKAGASKKCWDLKGIPAKASPSYNKKLVGYDCWPQKDIQKTSSIGKDLHSISISLENGKQQQILSPAFGKASLRPTEHGKAVKQGNEIRSRKIRRAQKLAEEVHQKQEKDVNVQPVSETLTEKLLQDLPHDHCEDGDTYASKMNDSIGSLGQKTMKHRSPVPQVSPAPRNDTINHRALSSPLARANLHPTGPTKELREGTEKGRKFLRLLELSELMIEKSESTFQDSGGSLDYYTTQERAVSTRRDSQWDEGDVESVSSDKTDIFSGYSDKSPETSFSDENGHKQGFHCNTSSVRPNYLRGMSLDRLEKNPVDGFESEESVSPCVNNLRPSYVRGLSFENINDAPKPRRAGRRPVAKFADENEEGKHGDTWVKVVKGKRREPHRLSRVPKKTVLRPPGDTSSEEDEESLQEEEDPRATLANTPKMFRRRALVYCLPKKKRDIIRKIARKRSVRPKVTFFKLLPCKKPTIKGLLHCPIDDSTDNESDGSSETPTMTNCSKIARKRQDPASHPRKQTWNPPKPTPPPAPLGNDSSPSKPVWTETHLKPTGQKEKIEAVGNLAKPITFPEKQTSTPVFSLVALRPTEQGEALQKGAAILSRRARRKQELNQKMNKCG
eukprot:scaffold1494_cov233-Amphora_coffeaeformis.AAC.1